MTVFVAHAPVDRETAEAVEKHLERRGQFVELDDGQTALRPVQQSDMVVLLLSQDFVFAPARLRLEQRALDAWVDGRLILVKLDHGLAPVGLRDLPAVDASFEAQREFKWQEIANSVIEKLRAPLGAASDGSTAPPPAPRAAKRGGGLWGSVLPLLLAIPGLIAAAATASIWLANRIGPTPGTLTDLRRGIDEFGVRYGMPSGLTEWLFLAALLLTLCVFALFVARLVAPRAKAAKREAEAPRTMPAPATEEAPASDAVFVSYARANAKDVLPVIEGAKAEGRKFWIDQQGIVAGDGWAGEIVRAIKTAGGVVVMCSRAAFESDHVKREIYLADRYHKKLTPVFIEQAEPPEDFEYFFAGVQLLNLFETPEAERPQALMRALGA